MMGIWGSFEKEAPEGLSEVLTLLRLSLIRRYSREHTVRNQSVAEHSYGVTCLALYQGLWLGLSHRALFAVLVQALAHDWEEAITGDVDYRVKHQSDESREAWEKFERVATRSHTVYLSKLGTPQLLPAETLNNLLKQADYAEFLWFCSRELLYGNREAEEWIRNGYEIVVNTQLESGFWTSPIGELLRTVERVYYIVTGFDLEYRLYNNKGEEEKEKA